MLLNASAAATTTAASTVVVFNKSHKQLTAAGNDKDNMILVKYL